MATHTHGDLAECRDLADQHRPTFADLHGSGVTLDAIALLYVGRDMLHEGRTAEHIAATLAQADRGAPLTVDDVYPDGPPCRCNSWGLSGCLAHRDYDPTDAEFAGIVWAAKSRGLS